MYSSGNLTSGFLSMASTLRVNHSKRTVSTGYATETTLTRKCLPAPVELRTETIMWKNLERWLQVCIPVPLDRSPKRVLAGKFRVVDLAWLTFAAPVRVQSCFKPKKVKSRSWIRFLPVADVLHFFRFVVSGILHLFCFSGPLKVEMWRNLISSKRQKLPARFVISTSNTMHSLGKIDTYDPELSHIHTLICHKE